MKIALFHDNLAQMGGAERVTEVLYRTLPGADLYSTLSVPERLSAALRDAKPRTTWMQRLPRKAELFRHYFMFYPLTVGQVDLSAYDLVVSSCFGFAKGVRRAEGAVHVCYCHTPMRWVWRADDYFAKEKISWVQKAVLSLALKPLRAWECRAANRPDFYIANSRVVAQRLQDSFGIDSVVIPPPIETSRFRISSRVSDFFLIISRLVPYKRLDIAIKAATALGVPLKVVGGGPDEARLRSLAGPNVEFLGRQPDAVVEQLMSQCKALLFPGEEDFGMTPLETNAAGRPVIAFYGGGAMETIHEGLNGLFFHQNSAASVEDAMRRFEQYRWDPQAIQAHARTYDTSVFQARVQQFLLKVTDGRFPVQQQPAVKELAA